MVKVSHSPHCLRIDNTRQTDVDFHNDMSSESDDSNDDSEDDDDDDDFERKSKNKDKNKKRKKVATDDDDDEEDEEEGKAAGKKRKHKNTVSRKDVTACQDYVHNTTQGLTEAKKKGDEMQRIEVVITT